MKTRPHRSARCALPLAAALVLASALLVAHFFRPAPSHYTTVPGRVTRAALKTFALERGSSVIAAQVQVEFDYMGARHRSTRILCDTVPSVSAWVADREGVREVEALVKLLQTSQDRPVQVRQDAPQLSCLFMRREDMRKALETARPRRSGP